MTFTPQELRLLKIADAAEERETPRALPKRAVKLNALGVPCRNASGRPRTLPDSPVLNARRARRLLKYYEDKEMKP